MDGCEFAGVGAGVCRCEHRRIRLDSVIKITMYYSTLFSNQFNFNLKFLNLDPLYKRCDIPAIVLLYQSVCYNTQHCSM